MSVTLLLVGLVVFAFFVGHVLNRYISRYVALSGAEYVLVGALIGPQLPPRLVTTDSLDKLVPLMSLLLGLTGFLVGLRARKEFSSLRLAIPGTVATLGVTLLVAAGSVTFFLLLGYEGEGPLLFQLPIVSAEQWVIEATMTTSQLYSGLAIGAAAAVASSGLLITIGDHLHARSATFHLLRTSAAVSQLLAIVTIGVVLAIARGASVSYFKHLGPWAWVGGAIGLGLLCGVCFLLFIGSEKSTSRIFLATVGTVTFAAGAGSALGVSPLFVNLVAGLTVGQLSRSGVSLRKELNRLQHPIFVLLLILTGAFWQPMGGALWLLPPIYILTRILATRTLFKWLSGLVPQAKAERLGLGMLAQGTLAVAVAVDFALQMPTQGSVVLSTVLVGTLVCDMSASGTVRRVLVDAEAQYIGTPEEGQPQGASS